jgi:hypothetical protein
MANTREELVNRFFAVNGAGKIQSADGVALANGDIDTREKCTITREEVITRRERRDCRNEDIVSSDILTRLARYTLNFAEVTPQIMARYFAWFAGGAAGPTGTPANEVQNINYSGTVNSGTFKLKMTLEGRVVTTKAIAYNASTVDLIAALTAARMLYIHPGDITALGGIKQVETLAIVGTANANGNLPVTVTAANSVALAAGKVINVAILNLDTNTAVAGKVRAALAADVDVAAFFTISGAGANVIGTAKTPAANDITMDFSNTGVLGITAGSSANTTAGVAGTIWAANGINLTFANRLAHANLPLFEVVESTVGGGGSVVVTSVTNGDQNYHAFTRATARTKVKVTFALGYEDMTGTIEKFADYVVETFQPSANLDGDPALVVSLLGPWDHDSLEPGLTIPDCVNPTPLLTEDCKIEIDGSFQTADLNTLTNNLNDNVPTDRLSAFQYDGIDVQRLIRGKQPTYTGSTSIFGLAGAGTDATVATLAQNERTSTGVPVIQHYGMPGNRFTLIYPNAKVRFQNNRDAFVGAAEFSAIQLELVPQKDGANAPIKGEAYLNQGTAFLAT